MRPAPCPSGNAAAVRRCSAMMMPRAAGLATTRLTLLDRLRDLVYAPVAGEIAAPGACAPSLVVATQMPRRSLHDALAHLRECAGPSGCSDDPPGHACVRPRHDGRTHLARVAGGQPGGANDVERAGIRAVLPNVVQHCPLVAERHLARPLRADTVPARGPAEGSRTARPGARDPDRNPWLLDGRRPEHRPLQTVMLPVVAGTACRSTARRGCRALRPACRPGPSDPDPPRTARTRYRGESRAPRRGSGARPRGGRATRSPGPPSRDAAAARPSPAARSGCGRSAWRLPPGRSRDRRRVAWPWRTGCGPRGRTHPSRPPQPRVRGRRWPVYRRNHRNWGHARQSASLPPSRLTASSVGA